MFPDDIQERALKTWYPKNTESHYDKLHPLIALSGEAGEVLNLYKKDRFKPGFTATKEQYLDELGDCLFYLAILTYQHGYTLDELSQMNREKLRDGANGWLEADTHG